MNKIIINGKSNDQLSVHDRAFQYADGIFETIAFKNNQLVYWQEHLQRLNHACKLLGMEVVAENTWIDDINKTVNRGEDQAIKIIYSRGIGERGYRFPESARPLRVIMASSLAEYPDDLYQQGVRLTVCKTPASSNARLAGIKHLNKLENVLARNEWQDPKIFEGVMQDDAGNVIEGTMTNLFAVNNDSLYTPILKTSGVNGIIRQRVIELAKNANIITQQIEIKLDKLLAMDEIFITNSLLGLCPVNQIDDTHFEVGPVTRQLIILLQQDMHGREL